MTETRTAPEPGAAALDRPPAADGVHGNRAPWVVRASTPLTNRLMRLGMPTGPNVLLTVRGRTSGLPRTAPVAVVGIDGRRYVIGAYGDVQWVRNLRAAGEGSIRLGGQEVPVTARELEPVASLAFFDSTMPAFIRRLPRVGRASAAVLFRFIAPDILRDPARAAAARPVFELIAAPLIRGQARR
ncbi:MAG: nitroreductase family deazaflavin-dependent oxidoreductase [Candidatus Limnocylindrales bacterium]